MQPQLCNCKCCCGPPKVEPVVNRCVSAIRMLICPCTRYRYAANIRTNSQSCHKCIVNQMQTCGCQAPIKQKYSCSTEVKCPNKPIVCCRSSIKNNSEFKTYFKKIVSKKKSCSKKLEEQNRKLPLDVCNLKKIGSTCLVDHTAIKCKCLKSGVRSILVPCHTGIGQKRSPVCASNTTCHLH